jgi:hypothetical protein
MPDTLSSYAQSQPGKPGVIHDKPDGTVVTWTYAELEAQSNRVANLLLRLGAGPGTKVLWCGPNSPEVVAVMNATRKIGAVAVPLNYRLTPEEALYIINHSDAEVAYVDYEHVPMFAALRDQLEKVRHIVAVGGPAPDGMLTDADIGAAPPGAPDVGDAAGAGGTMIYTSGTTGKPKGAVRAGGPDPELLGALLNLFGYRPDDIYITSGPLYHSGPSAFMSAGLLYGQTIIVQRKFQPEDWLRLDRRDHFRRHERLPRRNRGRAGAASRDLRGRGVRDPVAAVGRGRARDGRAVPGIVTDRRGDHGVRARAPGRLQGAAIGGVRGRTAAHRIGQAPQATAPGPLLGWPDRPGRIGRAGPPEAGASWSAWGRSCRGFGPGRTMTACHPSVLVARKGGVPGDQVRLRD